jgi:linoleoyl-CoA desaturase
MVAKTICALGLYVIPFIAMLVFQIQSLPVLIALWLAMGAGMAFIGTSVMHDAIHGSYTRNKRWTRILSASTWLLGVDATIWKTQHNVLHHSFTNLEGADEDIHPRFLFRFSPHQKRRWFNRFQNFYAAFIYGISTLVWVLFKDFIKARQYQKKGLLRVKSFPKYIAEMALRKLLYFGVFLALPIYVLPVTPVTVILLFIAMHFCAGILLSMIFQPAHIMEVSDFFDEKEEENHIHQNRLVHQLRTTTNFGMKSRILTWLSGGLNYQIEHHLFPNICHVHYRRISHIVRETVTEYGIPYHTQPSLSLAVYHHLKMLKALGKGEI